MAKDKNKIEVGNRLRVEPFESVLVISMEYIALPRDKMAIILPRARVTQRGLLIHATRVHPTWHGKLAFVIINLSRRPIEIETGAQIASMVVLKAEEGGTLPPREDLGRESLDVDLRRRAKEPAKPKDVIIELEEVIEDIEKLAEKYGPPFNIFAEGIKKRFEEIRGEIEKLLIELLKKKTEELEKIIKREVVSEVEKEVSNKVIPTMHSWLGSIVVLVLTLAVAFLQYTLGTPDTRDMVTQPIGAVPNINTTKTELTITSTPRSDRCVDKLNILLTKIFIPGAMLMNLILLAVIFLLLIYRIETGRRVSGTSNTKRSRW